MWLRKTFVGDKTGFEAFGKVCEECFKEYYDKNVAFKAIASKLIGLMKNDNSIKEENPKQTYNKILARGMADLYNEYFKNVENEKGLNCLKESKQLHHMVKLSNALGFNVEKGLEEDGYGYICNFIKTGTLIGKDFAAYKKGKIK